MPAPKKKTAVKKPSAAKPAAKAKASPKKATVKKAAAKPAKKATTKAPAKKAKAPVKKSAPKKAPAPKVVKKADAARDLAIDMARMASDLHCTDVLVQDVSGHSPITRFMVLASGVSNRQLKAVADQLEDLGVSRDYPRYKSDADANTTWVVLDLVEIVVHLFEPSARSHYDLETLFPDAKNVKWAR